jgi:hypothetical protein
VALVPDHPTQLPNPDSSHSSQPAFLSLSHSLHHPPPTTLHNQLEDQTFLTPFFLV